MDSNKHFLGDYHISSARSFRPDVTHLFMSVVADWLNKSSKLRCVYSIVILIGCHWHNGEAREVNISHNVGGSKAFRGIGGFIEHFSVIHYREFVETAQFYLILLVIGILVNSSWQRDIFKEVHCYVVL